MAVFGNGATVTIVLTNSWDICGMEQSATARILVGPYGLHAFGFVVLGFFLAFLWVFNFTNFF